MENSAQNTDDESITLVTRLPQAVIMAYQPTSLDEALNLLDIIFANPFYAGKPEGEKARLRAYLAEHGLPDPASYTVFAISHTGDRTDIDLKCLLLLGMVRLAMTEGDLDENDARPFLRSMAEIYLEYGLLENSQSLAPARVRIVPAR